MKPSTSSGAIGYASALGLLSRFASWLSSSFTSVANRGRVSVQVSALLSLHERLDRIEMRLCSLEEDFGELLTYIVGQDKH